VPDEAQLIYDWNTVDAPPKPAQPVAIHDETLRDGIQGPSVRDPDIEHKLRFLHLADELGVGSIDLGLPGSGPRAVADVERLAQEIRDQRLRIKALCAARTLEVDIRPVVEISQRVGIPIEVAAFIGSSPIRQYAEGWTIEQMVDNTRKAVRFARQNQLPVLYVTEDTTRAQPETLRQLFGTAIEEGAARVAVCDTVGHSTPDGARAVVRYVRRMLDEMKPGVGLDWHGHSDRGLGVINSIEAAVAGADRIHGCALGLGERVGNAHLDLLLVNFRLMGWIDTDLSKLREMGDVIAEGTGMAIPANYPVLGRDAFRTATGVHAAAVIKAMRKGDDWLANRVYSGVPAELFGREQVIEIGPMSGESNVVFWLEQRGIEPRPELVKTVLDAAKQRHGLLSEADVLLIVDGVPPKAARLSGQT
jgi:2-isopropylmalate synthase